MTTRDRVKAQQDAIAVRRVDWLCSPPRPGPVPVDETELRFWKIDIWALADDMHTMAPRCPCCRAMLVFRRPFGEPDFVELLCSACEWRSTSVRAKTLREESEAAA